ncbi:GNAT family N-acetyltransferase [Clostridium sp.]|uniref:GNAT family N-acetyltransferase n=1 Tax=Clostridium sp. TaxID=1506 RepID=UPI001A5AE67D|nr:GNAT family N-acetyltransferase [Clostridium sp.]MBK5234114.1 GNAT family N-acetyltransferase [Clostridium sp.]
MANFSVRYINEEEFYKWDNFVDESPQGTLFSKIQWLKAVCVQFKILVVEENNQFIGGIALPYTRGELYRNPKLTPQLGILLPKSSSKAKYSTVLSKETSIIVSLIEKLQHCRLFDYNFSYNFTNFLPFIWEGYSTAISYTYVIEDLQDLDKIYSNFQYDVKYSINKAVKNNIKVVSDLSIEQFYEINKKTFKRQGMEMPYSFEFLRNMDEKLKAKNCRKILFGIDDNNNILAANYIVYDSKCAYYLIGGSDPIYRKSGVQTLLLWESIKFAAQVSKGFDFEGSSIKNIEKYFRKFGGYQKIIHNVNKSSFIFAVTYKLLRKNKNIIRKVLKV